jgi:hypothetical protein
VWLDRNVQYKSVATISMRRVRCELNVAELPDDRLAFHDTVSVDIWMQILAGPSRSG